MNLRLLRPERSALPGCATPRLENYKTTTFFSFLQIYFIFVWFLRILLSITMRNKIIYLLALILLSSSCVMQPDLPSNEQSDLSGSAAYILCEGLWGMNNSRLDALEMSSGRILENFFENANNFRLGDVANDIVLMGDTAFIAVSESRIIEVINIKTGKSIGRISFGENSYPRRIFIANSQMGFVSDLYNACIRIFNPSTLAIDDSVIPVGPAPEGICGWGQYLFVANSGYGDYLADKPKAGTISVIDIIQMKEIAVVPAGENPVELLINDSKLYCIYYNLPSKADSLGGIVEYSLPEMKETRRLRCDAEKATLSDDGSNIFYCWTEGVFKIDLNKSILQPELIIKNPKPAEHWHSLAISPFDGSVWIGNARNYQVKGELLIYKYKDYYSHFLKYTTGVNPTKIVFFE